MQLSINDLYNIKNGWNAFKSGTVTEVFMTYRDGDEKHLDFIMQKDSWYYGENSYSVYIGGVYRMGFYKDALEHLVKALENI